MTSIGGDDSVMSNRALADLGLDDATRADFAACWDILCAAPPPELAEAHIHAAATLAAKAASHPRLTSSGRSLAKAAVISAAAFVGTTGLAAADVLPPAAVRVVETVANTVRDAVDPIPPELSTPAPAPAPAPKPASRAGATPAAVDAGGAAANPTTVPDNPTTTVAIDTSTSASTATTVTPVSTVVDDVTSTTTTIVDDETAPESGDGSTTTTVPDDGTAVAAGTGSTTTTTPDSTTTTEPSSTTTAPPPSTTP